MRDFCGDQPSVVQRYQANRATGAPVYANKNKSLQVSLLTTNQAVGSSNLSGRAIFHIENKWVDVTLPAFFLPRFPTVLILC